MNNKVAFLFAGQGAQAIGMGKDLCEKYEIADKTYDEASAALGFDIKNMIFDGDQDTLMITENTQPAILTMSVAALRLLQNAGIKADVVAGLSLGEYTAHVASGSIEFSDAVKLVRERGRLMQSEVPLGVGTMAAIIGLNADDVREVCKIAGSKGIVEPANFNCPGQITVSGEVAAVEYACEVAKEKGAKRAMLLPVSAPFHCSMLKGAGDKLRETLNNINISDMQIPLISNVTADYIGSKEEIKDILQKQVSSSVLFEDSIRKMLADGVDTFVEIGPGKALSGFVKKINPDVRIMNVENVETFEKVVGELKK